MLSDELMQRLRKGDRPSPNGKPVDCDALLDAAKFFGIISNHFTGFPPAGLDKRTLTIDTLDREYPGWRGYAVPETEGVRDVK